jgi:hypothetical protein
VPRYRAAGLHIESGLALPGLCPAPAGDAPADVVVRVGEIAPSLPDPLERGANWELVAGALLLSIPGVARFLVREAGEIVVDPAAGTAAHDLAAFVAGPLLGLFLHLRGQVVLQASAVAVNGGAVLFCGETAAGKSTLAAALGLRGYRMICDDLCAIDLAPPGGPRALADATSLKLWAQATGRLDLEAGLPVRAALQKHHVAPPAGRIAAAPLRAIYFLQEARPPDAAGIARPNVVDLALLVRRSAFRPNVVRALDQRAVYFAAAAQLASAAGVFTFNRKLGFELMDGGLDMLEAHWTEIGLAPERAA